MISTLVISGERFEISPTTQHDLFVSETGTDKPSITVALPPPPPRDKNGHVRTLRLKCGGRNMILEGPLGPNVPQILVNFKAVELVATRFGWMLVDDAFCLPRADLGGPIRPGKTGKASDGIPLNFPPLLVMAETAAKESHDLFARLTWGDDDGWNLLDDPARTTLIRVQSTLLSDLERPASADAWVRWGIEQWETNALKLDAARTDLGQVGQDAEDHWGKRRDDPAKLLEAILRQHQVNIGLSKSTVSNVPDACSCGGFWLEGAFHHAERCSR